MTPQPTLMVYMACVVQWLLPGSGYFAMGRTGRAAVALVGIGVATAWGLYLGGELSVPIRGQFLSYLKAFACLGLGPAYFAVSGSDALHNGHGDVSLVTYDFGNTFILAAGLVNYLMILDVYDIAVGRKR